MGLGLDIELPNLPSFSLPSVNAAFQTGFLFELIDTRQAKPIDQHVFVLAPRRYTLSEPFQSTLTPTEDNTVIEETNGIIVREIQLEGTFGLKKRSPPRFSSSGQSDKDGNEQFGLLRKLFKRYSDLKQAPEFAPFTKLVFHSLRENDHFVVVPRLFEMPRDAKTARLHYEWRISLYAIGPAEDVRLKAVKDDYSFTDALRDINQVVSDAGAFFQDINRFKQDIKRKIANIDAILINVDGLITQAGLAIGNGALDNVIAYPIERAAQIVEEVGDLADTFANSFLDPPKGDDARLARAMRKLESSLQTLLVYPDHFQEISRDQKRRVERMYLGEKTLTQDDYDNETAGASDTTALRVQRGTEQDAGVDFGSAQSMLRVRVDALTTLESLSAQHAVAPEFIVLVNDLKAPYFSTGGFEGTRKPGDFILVPRAGVSKDATSNASTVAVNGAPSSSDPAAALYGSDLALDPDALAAGFLDCKEDLSHDADDGELVSGIANVKQALEIVVHTEKGETQFLPDIGLLDLTGEKGLLSNVVLSAITLQNTILEDDRIEAINEAQVTLEGDVLSHTVSPRLRGSQDGIEVVLPFGRATGA